MTTKPERLTIMLCESELRVLDESLAVETYLEFAERLGLNSAKKSVAFALDKTLEQAA